MAEIKSFAEAKKQKNIIRTEAALEEYRQASELFDDLQDEQSCGCYMQSLQKLADVSAALAEFTPEDDPLRVSIQMNRLAQQETKPEIDRLLAEAPDLPSARMVYFAKIQADTLHRMIDLFDRHDREADYKWHVLGYYQFMSYQHFMKAYADWQNISDFGGFSQRTFDYTDKKDFLMETTERYDLIASFDLSRHGEEKYHRACLDVICSSIPFYIDVCGMR